MWSYTSVPYFSYLFGKHDGVVYTEYKTDILRRKDNKKIEFSEIGRDDIEGIVKRAVELKCPVIVQTGPSNRYPGKWYLKGRGMDYNELKRDIEKSQEENKHNRTKLYLLKL